MRRVMTMTWIRGLIPGQKIGKQDLREGRLHGWATESDEERGGIKHIAVAIIEFEGGLVDTWPAHMVRFLDEPEAAVVMNKINPTIDPQFEVKTEFTRDRKDGQ